jgi:hypothetical protein
LVWGNAQHTTAIAVTTNTSIATATTKQTSMMGSQKVPGIVVLHCNGRTYGKAYLIRTCSIDAAIIGSTGKRLLLESFEIRPLYLI